MSDSTLLAADTMASTLSQAGILQKIIRLNLFAGNNLAACRTPYIIGPGDTIETITGIVAGDYSESSGITFANNSKWVDTGVNAQTETTPNSLAFGVYVRNDDGVARTAGAIGAWGTDDALVIYPMLSGSTYTDNARPARIIVANASTPGFYVSSRTSAALTKAYKNGAVTGTSTAAQGIPTNTTIVVGAFAQNSNPFWGSISGYFVASGLTDAEVATVTSAFKAFNDSLGRGVF